MITKRSLFGIACRAAALTFLAAGSASLMQAQQSPSIQVTPAAPLFLASESAPLDLASTSSSSSSSSSTDSVVSSDGNFLFSSAAHDAAQPPPRRYGRPNYSDSHSNPDGSEKWTFMGGVGLALPTGITHKYNTPSYDFQVGGGRNFNKSLGVIAQFNYDHLGLQGATLANQEYIYNYCTPLQVEEGCTATVSGLDGNAHVWSFSLNPTYTFETNGSLGAYVDVGGGFYHKVTNFTLPETAEECSLYGCGDYTVDETVDHYTSNALGVSGGFGLTWKFAKFSSERFYMDARYVLMLNSKRAGYTAQNVATTTYNGYDAYPANSDRTTLIPVTFGIRF